MDPAGLDSGMTVDEIMRRWPSTIRVFISNRMLCIGCPIGVFHTVKDACDAHGLNEAAVTRQLLDAIDPDPAELRSTFGAAESCGDDNGAIVCGSRPPATGRGDPSQSPSADRRAPAPDLPKRSVIG